MARAPDQDGAGPFAGSPNGRAEWSASSASSVSEAVAATCRLVARSVRRYKLLACTCFLAVAGLSLLALTLVPSRYRARATVLVQRPSVAVLLPNVPVGERQMTLARQVVLRHENLVELCRSTDFVERHERTLAPATRGMRRLAAWFGRREPDREKALQGAADAIAKRLDVWEDSTAGTVTMSFEWSNPGLAHDVVAAAVRSFLAAHEALDVDVLRESITALGRDEARLEQEVEQAARRVEERRRARLRALAAPARPPDLVVTEDEEVVRLEGELDRRRRSREELESLARRQVAELQGRLAQQLTVFGPQHPSVLATRRALDALERASPRIESLRAEERNLAAEIERRRADTGRRSTSAGGAEPSRLAFQRPDALVDVEASDRRVLLRELATVQERLEAARVELDTAQAAFKYRYVVVTPPEVPREPVRPRPLAVAFGGVIGGLAYALFACTLLESNRRTRRIRDQDASRPAGARP